MFARMPLLVFLAVLPGCALQPGQPINNLPWSSDVKVYRDDHVPRKYAVMKELHIKLRQISGPNYYDDLATVPMIERQAVAVGADAVINYRSTRIPGENILDPGYFEARGTAVKYVN